MDDRLAVGSLFGGIEGFGLAATLEGCDLRWSVEIDAECRRITERHFPEAALFEDVCAVGKHNLEPVDAITGGTPCQDLSLAGQRKGLAGERSGLFFEFARIIGELQPAWVIWENVPGAISSNEGRDLATVLDTFQDLGYIIDIDVLDAQMFGVPQRRRRIFVVCQRSESLLQKRTTTSALTFAQCLTEILLTILVEARHRSLSGYASSTSSSCISVDGLQRRMRLFGLNQSETWANWCNFLGDALARLSTTSGGWGCPHAESGAATDSTETATPSATCRASTASAFGDSSIALSWRTCWEDLYDLVRLFTTSTETSSITEQRIYTCAQALLHIASLICRSSPCCTAYWSAASSVSTALREYTNYARQTSSSLFGDVAWVQSWRDFIGQADGADHALIGAGVECPAQVLSFAARLSGDTPPRPEAGASVAASTGEGFAAGGAVGPLLGGHAGGHRIGADGAEGGQLVIRPILEAGARQGAKADKRDGLGIGEPDDPMFTLQAGKQHAVSFEAPPVADQVFGTTGQSAWREDQITLASSDDNGTNAVCVTGDATHALTSEGGDASEDGTGRGTPIIFESRFARNGRGAPEGICPPLKAQSGESGKGDSAPLVAFDDPRRFDADGIHGGGEHGDIHPSLRNTNPAVLLAPATQPIPFDTTQTTSGENRSLPQEGDPCHPPTPAVAFAENQRGEVRTSDISPQLTTGGGKPGQGYPAVADLAYGVRRLTPTECERLQGFPDSWTAEDAQGKPMSDSFRYRALGNAVTVPVARWIFARLITRIGEDRKEHAS